ncbi:MAG TPA: replicative DNA helicase [Salinimicrobium sp.]|nr:replicative DNA helicase [Salinimicrobium sp.]
MENGKSIPKSIKAEEAVIGAMLIDGRAPLEVMTIIKSSDVFYASKNRLIFEAVTELAYKNEAIDLLTVSQQLTRTGKLEEAGGDMELIQLSSKISSGANVEYHARILIQYWIKRKLIQKANTIISEAYKEDTDSLDLLEMDAKLNDDINEIVFTGSKETTYAAALQDVVDRVELISNQKEGEFTGVPTGFAKIDRFTGGWQPSDLIILAARPGMGKTAFILKNTVECGLRNIPVGFFSLEMSTQQLAARTVAINSNFHLSQLIRDGFAQDKYFVTLQKKQNEMNKFPIYIDDNPSLDIRDIIAKARIWKRKHNIQILFVDYIQLVSDKSKGNNREQEIASISRSLKGLAKELSVPVIALSQLSRAVETRTDKHPKLSDLRESGAIEQDADIVTFLYRHHYYYPDAELDSQLVEQGANAEFSFAKYRSGSLETKGLHFDANKVKYSDPEENKNNEWNANDLPKMDPTGNDNFF